MEQIHRLIDQEFQLGNYERYRIFDNICGKLGYEGHSEQTTENMIQNMHYFQKQREDNVLSYASFSKPHFDLLFAICEKYEKVISQFIEMEFQNHAYNRTKVFFAICQRLNYDRKDLPSEGTMENRFRMMSIEPIVHPRPYKSVAPLNFSKNHQHINEMINEQFWKKISSLAKDSFLEKNNEVQTFMKISQIINYTPLNVEKVDEMFEDQKIGRLFHEKSNYEHRKLVDKIGHDFLKYRNAVFYYDSQGGKLLNSRYQCSYYRNLANERQEITMIDKFHDQERMFYGSDVPKKHKGLKFVQFYSNQVLFLSDDGQQSYISLAELDFHSSSFKLLDTQLIYMSSYHFNIIFDTLDNRKFAVILGGCRRGEQVFSGRIQNGQQIVIDEKGHTFNRNFFCYELEADKLMGLKAGYDPDDQRVIDRVWFWEKRLDGNMANEKFKFEFVDYCNEGQVVSLENYTWFGDICYTMSNVYSIHAFDLKTRKCTEIHFGNLEYPHSPSIDQADFLLLSNRKYTYRFALRKPDTFLNIAWFNIRRQKMFFNKKIYDHALKVAPFSLQPFYIE